MYWFLKFYSFCLEKLPKLFLKINYKIHYFLLFHGLKLRKKMAIENLRIAFPEKDNDWYNTIIKKPANPDTRRPVIEKPSESKL